MKVIKKLSVADVITLLNIGTGSLLLYVILSNYSLPKITILLTITLFLDLLDGFIARRSGSSILGKDLDSFSDFLSFGICMGSVIIKGSIFPLNIVLGIFWIWASALRLANFNNSGSKEYYEGLPMSIAALLLILVLFLNLSIVLIFFIIVTLSLAMISSMKIRKLKL